MARGGLSALVAVGLVVLAAPTSALAHGNHSVSIADTSIVEGNGGATWMNFTITAAPAPHNNSPISVDWVTSDLTAAGPGDYATSSGTVSLTKNSPTAAASVSIVSDTIDEGNETLQVSLGNLVGGGTITDGIGVGTITDDDAAPAVSVDDVTVSEGDAGTVNATFTASLSAASGQATTVDYATGDATAVAPGDYTAKSGTLVFTAGQTSKTVDVSVNGDTTDEVNETFTIGLSNPAGITIADGTGVGTITDDDAPPTVSIADASIAEGDSGSTTESFAASLSAASGKTVTVDWGTSNGTAVAPGDYTANSGTLTFVPGDTAESSGVSVNGDNVDEDDETYTVDLSNPGNVTIADGTGVGTIADDDPAPVLSVSDESIAETNAGTTTITYTVTLSAVSSRTVTVDHATADGTAGAPGDYTSTSGTLTFVPGDDSETVSVTVNGDTVYESDETLSLDLSNPSNASILDGTGAGTITNDDAAPTLAIDDVTSAEGTGGSTTMAFTATLTGATERTATVDYATADGSAAAPGDYTTASGTFSFVPGDTTETVAVTVDPDTTFEANETFTVNLSNPTEATIADASGTGTINDDDGEPTVSIADGSQAEGDAGTSSNSLTASLSNPSASVVTVDFATSDGTASSATDYSAGAGTLTFAPGDTSEPVDVSVNGDTTYEDDETFVVDLSNPTNITILDGTATGTITNDDPLPAISIADVSVAEGNAGTSTATFVVSLSNPSENAVTADWMTNDGTAQVLDLDYVSGLGTVTFPAGDVSETIDVSVGGDVTEEADEAFTVDLSNPSGASIADAQGVGTIVDDDGPPGISIGNASVAEDVGGSGVLTFDVTLSHASAVPVSVAYATTAGTATSPTDFVDSFGTVTFLPGDTSQPIDVTLTGDDPTYELDETFTVDLSLPVNGVLVDDQGLGTIFNDDPLPTVSVNDVTVTEGNAGTATATFTVSLGTASSQVATVDWTSNDGTALGGSDYVADSNTVTFSALDTSETVSISVNGDTTDEPDETFTVGLTGVSGATIVDAAGLATIDDDDKTLTNVTLAVKKTRTKIQGKGLLTNATTGMKVVGTLYKKKGTKYVKVATKIVSVKSIMDRNGDTILEGAYLATFKRPKIKGLYQVKAAFAGDVEHLTSSALKSFKL